MILAGDVGGTKTHVGLFDESGSRHPIREMVFASPEYEGLLPVVLEFLAGGSERIDAAVFGIAGPVVGGKVKTPNLPWEVDPEEIADRIGVPRVELMNDLEATAEGLLALRDDEFTTIAEGRSVGEGAAALIAAGTGLGMCVVARPGGAWLPMAGEGGHQTFAARNDDEFGLARFLAARFGHVSVERVVSGPGLVAIFEYLTAVRGLVPAEEVLRRISVGNPAAVISAAGMAGRCPAAAKAVRMFTEAYGAAAGNLALVALARRGVYVGGGIAPKMLAALTGGAFMAGFLDKGRFGPFLADVPVRVIDNPEAALYGAARRAASLIGAPPPAP